MQRMTAGPSIVGNTDRLTQNQTKPLIVGTTSEYDVHLLVVGSAAQPQHQVERRPFWML